MQDEPGPYHTASNFVHVSDRWSFEIDRLWTNIDEIEAGGISLEQIGLALGHNWPATVTALAFKNIATLHTLIAEASP